MSDPMTAGAKQFNCPLLQEAITRLACSKITGVPARNRECHNLECACPWRICMSCSWQKYTGPDRFVVGNPKVGLCQFHLDKGPNERRNDPKAESASTPTPKPRRSLVGPRTLPSTVPAKPKLVQPPPEKEKEEEVIPEIVDDPVEEVVAKQETPTLPKQEESSIPEESDMDLSKMTPAELTKLSEALTKEKKRREEEEARRKRNEELVKTYEEWAEVAHERFGMSVSLLVKRATALIGKEDKDQKKSATLKKEKKSSSPYKIVAGQKYQDPDNPDNVWIGKGKGRKPKWMEAHQKKGTPLEDLKA